MPSFQFAGGHIYSGQLKGTPMANVTIYTRQFCGFCSAAKRLLDLLPDDDLALGKLRFDAALTDRGYLAMGGQIIDATVVPAPKQRNTEAAAYHLNHLNQRIVKMPRVANPS